MRGALHGWLFLPRRYMLWKILVPETGWGAGREGWENPEGGWDSPKNPKGWEMNISIDRTGVLMSVGGGLAGRLSLGETGPS